MDDDEDMAGTLPSLNATWYSCIGLHSWPAHNRKLHGD